MINRVLIIFAAMAVGACSAPENNSGPEQTMVDDASQTTHLGGCILLSPLGNVPEDPYQRSDIVATTAISPFTKELQVYGLQLAARDDISDDFMRLVAQAITEVFPQDESFDLVQQKSLLQHHYRYRALIPVPLGDDFSFMEDDPERWAELESENSICDIIMQDVPVGQVMEVVEHILHYVTSIGLHYQFPEVWGISQDSILARAMRIAVDEGYYDVSGYDDIGDPAIRFRVEMQEFAYWFISTAWNLQTDYGPTHEQEWTIRDREELQEKLPKLFVEYEQTAARIMRAPSLETLQRIGPTRAEEAAN
ncbi:MAG: hypothetical protein P8M18_00300 [Woeseiaceae bacterium]|nr:hypothetical protein [Woeseiaceae bacterium]